MHEEYSEITITIIAGTLVLLLLGFFVIGFMFLYKSRHNKYVQEKQVLQSQFQEILLQSQLEIKEQTLHTISQEIHDNIGQVLSLAKLNLGTMDINKPDQLQPKIDDSKKLIGKAIQDLRDLSKVLNTDYISEMGFVQAIGYELEMIRKSGSYSCNLITEGLPVKLEAQKELIIFRITQEVINNIIKHARATNIFVSLTYQQQAFTLSINDNGTGFDLSPLTAGENSKFGLGIRNMHKRAQLIGGEFSITSTTNVGTTVTLSLPLIPSQQPVTII